mmetsp:Transcript_70620/g.187728  ORF Transcript_70620/g.187728 Transcript_70620/m.187728 type:complete len:109 (-) Transcript_70620:30-356(-)|eukprot:CAMPEP_0171186882 /NCGR_PEP_ID=MMETSP0790-20130122/17038_1 /TAXON_ID=2925 /ORGANISM="Alexandrium catenella, Strain OF101" /LENGTH=108 /DNA_ID=CAMNT_0011651933 /DNA_START=69 /DNA_END=398 /DNA_ORIENTATION=-
MAEGMPVGNAWDFYGVKTIKVQIDGQDEEVQVDGEMGPIVRTFEGGQKYDRWDTVVRGTPPIGQWMGNNPQQFRQMSFTGREVMVCIAAKKNRRLKERLGEYRLPVKA